MMFFSFLSHKIIYDFDIVDSVDKLPPHGRVINIPGTKSLTCIVSDKVFTQKPENDIPHLLKYINKKCMTVLSDGNKLFICFNQNSTYNSINLGNTSSFSVDNNSVYVESINGTKCSNTTNYKLRASIFCDPNRVSSEINVQSYFLDPSDNCTVYALVGTHHVCSFPIEKRKPYSKIKCIDSQLYKSRFPYDS